MKKWTLSRI